MSATIYRRKNGGFGASCDGTSDTGHTIIQQAVGRYTVLSIHDEEMIIAVNAKKAEAEAAIADDWRSSP